MVLTCFNFMKHQSTKCIKMYQAMVDDYDAFFDQFREVFLSLTIFWSEEKSKTNQIYCLHRVGDGLGGMGLQGRQANRHVLNGVASGYNKPAPKTYARVAVPANERGLVNSHELPSLPIHSYKLLIDVRASTASTWWRVLTSRLPKPLTRTTNFRICNSLSKRRDYLMPWVGH